MNEWIAARRMKSLERSGFDFDELIAAGRAAVPPDCGSHVRPAYTMYTDRELGMLEHRLGRLEDRVQDIWSNVHELRGELRELAWQVRRDR